MCNIKRLATIGMGVVCIACLSACNINVNIQNPESESASEIIAAEPSPSERTTNPEESKVNLSAAPNVAGEWTRTEENTYFKGDTI